MCFEEFQRVPEWREVKGTDLRAFLTRFDLDHITESCKRRYQASCLLWAASRTEMTSLREPAVQLIITLPRSPVLYILLMSSAQSANDSCTCPETHTWTITTDRHWCHQPMQIIFHQWSGSTSWLCFSRAINASSSSTSFCRLACPKSLISVEQDDSHLNKCSINFADDD